MSKRLCPECNEMKEKFHQNRSSCADCSNSEYNEKNRVLNLKGCKTRQGMKKPQILTAAKKMLNAGEELGVRAIVKAVGSKNTGLIDYHFGSYEEFLILLKSEIDS